MGLVEELASSLALASASSPGGAAAAADVIVPDLLHALRALCAGHAPNAWRLHEAGGWTSVKAGKQREPLDWVEGGAVGGRVGRWAGRVLGRLGRVARRAQCRALDLTP